MSRCGGDYKIYPRTSSCSWEGPAEESQEPVHPDPDSSRCAVLRKSAWVGAIQNKMWKPKWIHPTPQAASFLRQYQVWSFNGCDPAPPVRGKDVKPSGVGKGCSTCACPTDRSELMIGGPGHHPSSTVCLCLSVCECVCVRARMHTCARSCLWYVHTGRD